MHTSDDNAAQLGKRRADNTQMWDQDLTKIEGPRPLFWLDLK